MSEDRTRAGGSRRGADSRVGTDSNRLSRLEWLGIGTIVAGVVVLVLGDRSWPLVGTDSRVLVVVVAVAAMLLGLVYAVDRDVTTGAWWRPSDPESGYRVPVPGDEFDALTERERKDRIRHRVVVSLIDATDCSRAAAERHVENGTWTNDRLAVTYLGEGIRPPVLVWLSHKIRGKPIQGRAQRRTIAAIRALRNGDAVPRIDESGPENGQTDEPRPDESQTKTGRTDEPRTREGDRRAPNQRGEPES